MNFERRATESATVLRNQPGDRWTVPVAGRSRKSGARVSVPHKSRKISQEKGRGKKWRELLRREQEINIPLCSTFLSSREIACPCSPRIIKGILRNLRRCLVCVDCVINARIQNKSTHEPRISARTCMSETKHTVRICCVALCQHSGVIRGFWVICYGDCREWRLIRRVNPNFIFIDYELNREITNLFRKETLRGVIFDLRNDSKRNVVFYTSEENGRGVKEVERILITGYISNLRR